MKQPTPNVREERIVFRADTPLVEEFEEVVEREYEGNRSLALRQAMRDLIARYKAKVQAVA